MSHELMQKIENFLKDRRVSEDSGWASVEDGDEDDLRAIIKTLIEEKWEKDCDGDLPMRCKLTDRTRYEHSHFCDVPYGPHCGDQGLTPEGEDALRDEILDTCIHNASMAMERIKTAHRISQNHRRKQEDAASKYKKGDIVRCVVVDKGLTCGKVYECYGKDFWVQGRKRVGIMQNDIGTKFTSYPVECFEKVNNES